MQTHLAEYIESQHPGLVVHAEVVNGETILHTTHANLIALMLFLRSDPECNYTILMDIAGVDYPDRPLRLDVVYQLLSIRGRNRVRVKLATDDNTPVPSIVEVFPTAGWFEREAWDMYGILFAGNPDLRRILTDYGFDGHPQRKDFPLTGYVEMRYDNTKQRIVYEPVKLAQAYRSFDFLSPWEGNAEYVLPGDEKATKP